MIQNLFLKKIQLVTPKGIEPLLPGCAIWAEQIANQYSDKYTFLVVHQMYQKTTLSGDFLMVTSRGVEPRCPG